MYNEDGFFNPNSQYNPQYAQQQQQQQQQSPFYDPSSFFNAQTPYYNPMMPSQSGAGGAQSAYQSNDYFIPTQGSNKIDSETLTTTSNGKTSYEQEPPLLEELGINFDHIYRKTVCVLNPFSKPHETIIHDTDLAGPLVFCIAYGFSLLLLGKIQFGYVYGITVLGCLSMYSLLNLMSDNGVSAICISSTLGYCLLPMVILSFMSNLIALKTLHGLIISIIFILWCSISASKLFVYALNMSNQQVLVLYPCSLLYGIFALLNIF